jgi:hypothetical protein
MKTEELIHALAEDAAAREPTPGRTLAVALLTGALVGAVVFAVLLGPRPDIAESVHQWRFLFKFAVTGALAAAAVAICARLMLPVVSVQTRAWLLSAPLAVVLAGLAVELASVPQDAWGARLIGVNWLFCLVSIPTIAAAPLVAVLLALRRGAPSRPALAGAVAGLSAGAIAAVFYALHCPDDSPLFVATWYTLAIGLVTAAGAFAGRRFLRW